MKSEEAAKLLDEMGLDYNELVVMQIRLGDMLMLNELIEAARVWRQESFYSGASDCSATDRLAAAIDDYAAADDYLAAAKKKAQERAQDSSS